MTSAKAKLLLAGAFVVIVGLALVAWPRAGKDGRGASAQGSASPRVVRLTTAADAVSSGKETLAVVIGGTMPHGAVRATVMTDEDCAPDARGYSHCRNDVRLADGSVLALRHNHRMTVVPCLAPGERIVVES